MKCLQFLYRERESLNLDTRKLPKNIANIEDSQQVVRASGSVGANYIEANEALSKIDFLQLLKNQSSLFRI